MVDAMATTDRWAQPRVVREQITLFQPTLDDMILQDHEVRLLDETLRTLDWAAWEAKYKRGGAGQPPIHPRVLAGIWLYAMMRRIRTSRPLEYACGHNVDFMWLAEGRTPDHTTLATFFSKNQEPLKDLFKQVCRMALTMGMVRLGEVGFDATRVKAANSRYATLTTPSIEKKLAAIDAQIEAIAAATATALEDAATAGGGGGTGLPEGLQSLEERRKKLAELAEVARTRDEERRQAGTDPKQKPAQVPTTDPQSKVMPNKEGGFAPNYTPTALTDGASGIILDSNVLDEINESGEALPAVDRQTELCGEAPENFLSDGGNASGVILAGLEERGINAVVPVKSTEPASDNPARRDDLTQPVPEEQWEQLPRNPQGQLDKSNFVYDAERDVYHCPGGRELPCDSRATRNGVERQRYRSLNCDGCPLVALCLQKKKGGEPATGADGRVRTISRDAHAEVRERAAARMATPESKAQYARRSPIAETPFAWLKAVLGLRQFRHVGLEKVETEWRWACLTLNLKKILSVLSRLRRLAREALSEAALDV
jgi:transposase